MSLSPASSRGSSGTGSAALITSVTLGADGTFDVSGLSQAYNDLVLSLIVRGTRASTAEFLQLQLNADTGAHYDSATMNGASVPATFFAQTSATLSSAMAAATASANQFSVFEIVIFGYASVAFNKTILSHSFNPITAGSSVVIEESGGIWQSSAAVTRVTLFGGTTANLKAGSILRVYGR